MVLITGVICPIEDFRSKAAVFRCESNVSCVLSDVLSVFPDALAIDLMYWMCYLMSCDVCNFG